MKPFPAILVAAALSAGATAGLLEILRPVPGTANETSERGAASPQDARDQAAREELASRPAADLVAAVDPMETERIRQLEQRVADLERQLERRPVLVPESAAGADAAALDADDPEARQLVLDVLAAEEARKEAERDARREQERLDSLRRRADSVAEKVGLNEKQSSELIEIWLAEETQRNSARDTLRDTGFDGARELFQAIDQWKAQELTQRFGEATATAIAEADSRFGQRNRGGRGGRGGN